MLCTRAARLSKTIQKAFLIEFAVSRSCTEWPAANKLKAVSARQERTHTRTGSKALMMRTSGPKIKRQLISHGCSREIISSSRAFNSHLTTTQTPNSARKYWRPILWSSKSSFHEVKNLCSVRQVNQSNSRRALFRGWGIELSSSIRCYRAVTSLNYPHILTKALTIECPSVLLTGAHCRWTVMRTQLWIRLHSEINL